MKKVTLIGDSIRMHMQADVAAELAGFAEVWGPERNAGTSTNTLANLQEWVYDRPTDCVHINVGLHDLKRLPENDMNLETPLETYRQNVRRILTGIRDHCPQAKLIWARTTPVHDQRHTDTKGFDRREAEVQQYNAAGDAVARELGVEINDLHKVVMDAGMDGLLTGDGVHFTPEGNRVLAEAVAAKIRQVMKT